MFLVALSRQSNESAITGAAHIDQRTGCGHQRRSLIVQSVERAESPLQSRYSQRRPEARTDRIFRESAIPREMRRPDACCQCQPGKRFKAVIDKKSGQTTSGLLSVGKRRLATAVIENGAECLLIRLVKTVDARLKIVLPKIRVEACLPSGIRRTAVLIRRDWRVPGRTRIVRRVVVIQR